MALPNYTTQSASAYKANIDAAIATLRSAAMNGIAAGGSANAQTLTLAEPLTAYGTFNEFSFIPVADNTSGVVNLNVNGLGNKLVKRVDGGNLAVGDLDASGIAKVVYNGTHFVLLNPATAIVDLNSSQTLANKTLTSPVLNGSLSGTAFKDEDNMSSNSAVAVASQQSIKAFVDGHITGIDNPTDTAITMQSNLSSAWQTWTVDASAKFAWVVVYVSAIFGTSGTQCSAYVRKKGLTGNAANKWRIADSNTATGTGTARDTDMGASIVECNSSGQFEYYGYDGGNSAPQGFIKVMAWW